MEISRCRFEYLVFVCSTHGRSGARVNCHGIDAFASSCIRKNNRAWVNPRQVALTFSCSTVAFTHSSTFFFLFAIHEFFPACLPPPLDTLRSPLLVITASNLFVAITSLETTRIKYCVSRPGERLRPHEG